MSIDIKYIKPLILATERAAYGASLLVGKNDKIAADQASVDEMRNQLNKIPMKGKIVIGEGELDEAPMLYINEKVGLGTGDEFDIAVDPLEGTNFTAKNLPNALSVMAVSKKNCLLNAPDMYMEKIAVGPLLPKNLLDLDNTIIENINILSKAKNTTPNKLRVCILKRERHKKIIDDLLSLGVKIHFITDGDVSGVIAVGLKNLNIDMYVGIGGAPEGVLAAAALKCLGCQMQTRLIFNTEEEKNKGKKLGLYNFNKKYEISDMVKDDVLFSASGVTDGDIVKGIKSDNDYFYVETFFLHKSTNTNSIIKNKIKK
jgi:fructose-1,6-bisphosphatase II / sedoheptulose-1,7-bisphosphatase